MMRRHKYASPELSFRLHGVDGIGLKESRGTVPTLRLIDATPSNRARREPSRSPVGFKNVDVGFRLEQNLQVVFDCCHHDLRALGLRDGHRRDTRQGPSELTEELAVAAQPLRDQSPSRPRAKWVSY
jgi:hypothetical protein